MYFYYNIPCDLNMQDREESVLYCSTRCQKKGKTPRNPIGRESSVRLLSRRNAATIQRGTWRNACARKNDFMASVA
jgi:hypothetical protein